MFMFGKVAVAMGRKYVGGVWRGCREVSQAADSLWAARVRLRCMCLRSI